VRIVTLAVALAGVFVMLACGSSAPDADGRQVATAAASGALRYSVVTSGTIADQGRGGRARGRLMRSKASAARALRAWELDRAVPAAGRVDYARKSLVIVLGGSVPDTAYRLTVRRVSVASRRVSVRADVRRPAGAVGGMAISRPYTLLTVDRDDVASAGATVSVRVSGP
jgi:hypothetical protein